MNSVDLETLYRQFVAQRDPDFLEERRSREDRLRELLSPERIPEFDEGDLRELVRNLWAFEIWSNKDYIVGQILEGSLDDFRQTLRRGVYENESVGEKFDTLVNNLRQFGPAAASEMLAFLFPEQCAIYNDRGQSGLAMLGLDSGPKKVKTGAQYKAYCDQVGLILNRLRDWDGDVPPPADLLELNWFLFYLSNLETEEDSEGTPATNNVADDSDLDHDEIQDQLLKVGDGLGFDVDDEYAAAPGARIDVRWSTRVANLGVISYAFEVHRRGSRDSAILNLQKIQNADNSIQRLVIVSTDDQIERFRREINAISSDFAETVSFMNVKRVDRAQNLLGELKEILQDIDLMSGF